MAGVQKLKSKSSKTPKSKVEIVDMASVKRKKLDKKKKIRDEVYKKRIGRELERTLRGNKKQASTKVLGEETKPKRSTIILPKGTIRNPGKQARGFKIPIKSRDVIVSPTRFPDTGPIKIPRNLPGVELTKECGNILISGGEGLGNIIMLTPLVNALISRGFNVDLIMFPIPKDMEFKSMFRGYSIKIQNIVNGWDEKECEDVKNKNYGYTFITKWGDKPERILPWFKNPVKIPDLKKNTTWLWNIEETMLNFYLYQKFINPRWREQIEVFPPLAFVNCEKKEGLVIPPDTVGMHIGCKVGSIDWRRWKQWPYFQLLAKKFKSVVLFGTDEDYKWYTEGKKSIQWPESVTSLLEETPSVASLASAITKCSIFISNDSGVAHVAAAAGVPTFVLLGGTSGIKLQHSSIRVISKGLKCQPCYMSRACPKYTSECLYDLHPKEVFGKIKDDFEVKHFIDSLIPESKKGKTLKKVTKKKTPQISIVIGVRNRNPVSLRNLLLSLKNQTYRGEIEILIVDATSALPFRSRYKNIAKNFSCKYKYILLEHWNKPLILNYGIRNSNPKSKYVFCIDCDMLLQPKVIQRVVEELDIAKGRGFVSVRTRKVHDGDGREVPGKGSPIPIINHDLLGNLDDITDPEVIKKLIAGSYLCGLGASGGLHAASRKWFWKKRGYDERLFLWGSPDTDMFFRALGDPNTKVIYFTGVKQDSDVTRWSSSWGLENKDDKDIFLIHQFHPRRDINDPAVKAQWDFNRDIRKRLTNKKDFGPRNDPKTWGRIEGRKIITKKTGKYTHLEWKDEDIYKEKK